ncbi:hypothetical protein [Ruegeria sp.]|uniref:hypothetical protein n=1 Tax=Ruegeria sp. TaxID=1879320 RepID=UPI003B00A585
MRVSAAPAAAPSAASAAFSALDGWIDIFRAGTHTDAHGRRATWTQGDLAAIVGDYAGADPAPVVLGHPDTDGPAMGWVSGLRVTGDRLQARLSRLDAGFRAAVEAGRYGPRSVALAPLSTGWRLRHLGFLGASRPAIEGLSPSQFSARADGVLVFSCPQPEGVMNQPVFTSVRVPPQAAALPLDAQPSPVMQPVMEPVMDPGAARFTAQPPAQPPAQMPAQPPAQMQVQPIQQGPGEALEPHPLSQDVAPQFTAQAAQQTPQQASQQARQPALQFVPVSQPQGAVQPLFAAAPPAGALPPGASGVTGPQTRDAAEVAELASERQLLFAERQQIAAERLAREGMDRERGASARVAAHVQAGRVLPAEAQAYAALFCALDQGGGQITMAGVDGRPMALSPSQVLDGLISALPQRVPLGQGTALHPAHAPAPAFAQVGAQVGAQVSPEAQFTAATQDLANRARALMAADKSGALDLPTAIHRAANGETAQ